LIFLFIGDILLYIVIGVIVMHRKSIVFLILFSVVHPTIRNGTLIMLNIMYSAYHCISSLENNRFIFDRSLLLPRQRFAIFRCGISERIMIVTFISQCERKRFLELAVYSMLLLIESGITLGKQSLPKMV
jgi:hypothetical protein